MACVLTWPAFLENSLRNVWSVKTLDTWTTRSNDVSWKEKLKDIRSLSPFFRVQASLPNRRFMSQARPTRQFARSAKRVRSARWGEELRAKCRVRLSCLIKRLQEPIKIDKIKRTRIMSIDLMKPIHNSRLYLYIIFIGFRWSNFINWARREKLKTEVASSSKSLPQSIPTYVSQISFRCHLW